MLYTFLLARPFPHTLDIFSVQHFPDDASHWGDTSEILQSAIFVIKYILAMDGSGQKKFLTPKIGVWKSESLFFIRNGPPRGGVPSSAPPQQLHGKPDFRQ
jgi:hypothetical protein